MQINDLPKNNLALLYIYKKNYMNKELLKEISRFRLMVSYKPGLTLNEQETDPPFDKFSPANKELVEIYMVEDLSKMIDENVLEYSKKVEITVIPKKISEFPGVEFTIKVGDNILGTTTWSEDTRTSFYSLLNKKYTTTARDEYGDPIVINKEGWKVGSFMVTDLYDDFIEKYPKYKSFFEENQTKYLENNLSISQYVKNQINSVLITLIVKKSFVGSESLKTSLGNNKEFSISVEFVNEKLSRKEWSELSKNATTVNLGNENYSATKGTLFDLYDTEGIILLQRSDRRGQFRVRLIQSLIPEPVDLVLNIPPEYCEKTDDQDIIFPTPTPTPTPPPIIAPIELKLDLINAYEFDKVDKGGSSWWRELKPGEEGDSGQDQFDAFISQYNTLKNQNSNVWDKYLEFLKNNKVNIYGYASIDRPPTDKIIGRYSGCQNNKNIKDYNQCLSEKRAQQAVKDIVKEIPELDGILVPVGGGQTDQFDGKSYLNATSDETFQNRRIYGVFPKYETTP